MQLSIRGKNFKVLAGLRESIQSRLETALARHRGRVENVAVSLADLNGPKGGIDKQCRVVVRLRPRGKLTVEEVGTEFVAAAGRASDRLAYAVSRALERRRESRINWQGMSPRGDPNAERRDMEAGA